MTAPSESSDLAILEGTAHVPEHVVYRSFQAETLLLNLQTSRYHGVNATGGRLLELLEPAEGRLREAVEKLAEEYEMPYDEIAPDLAAFIADLEERGLVIVERSPVAE